MPARSSRRGFLKVLAAAAASLVARLRGAQADATAPVSRACIQLEPSHAGGFSTAPPGAVVTYSYDAWSRDTRADSDPMGFCTTVVYDAEGDVIRRIHRPPSAGV